MSCLNVEERVQTWCFFRRNWLSKELDSREVSISSRLFNSTESVVGTAGRDMKARSEKSSHFTRLGQQAKRSTAQIIRRERSDHYPPHYEWYPMDNTDTGATTEPSRYLSRRMASTLSHSLKQLISKRVRVARRHLGANLRINRAR